MNSDLHFTGQVKVKATLRLTVSQSVSLGVDPHLGLMTRCLLLFLTVTALCLWGALSDERMGLSFVYTAGPCQRSLSRVRVPWDSCTYFTVSDFRLIFSSPPTTRRVTVEVFDSASTWVTDILLTRPAELYNVEVDHIENTASNIISIAGRGPLPNNNSSTVVYLGCCCLAMTVVSLLLQGYCLATGLYAAVRSFSGLKYGVT
jgi:hypothetical protein